MKRTPSFKALMKRPAKRALYHSTIEAAHASGKSELEAERAAFAAIGAVRIDDLRVSIFQPKGGW